MLTQHASCRVLPTGAWQGRGRTCPRQSITRTACAGDGTLFQSQNRRQWLQRGRALVPLPGTLHGGPPPPPLRGTGQYAHQARASALPGMGALHLVRSHIEPGVLGAAASVSVKLIMICSVVAWLLRTERIPADTATTLSKVPPGGLGGNESGCPRVWQLQSRSQAVSNLCMAAPATSPCAALSSLESSLPMAQV